MVLFGLSRLSQTNQPYIHMQLELRSLVDGNGDEVELLSDEAETTEEEHETSPCVLMEVKFLLEDAEQMVQAEMVFERLSQCSNLHQDDEENEDEPLEPSFEVPMPGSEGPAH